MAVSGAKINDVHTIFSTIEEAANLVTILRDSADEGETFEVIANPVAGKTTAIVARYFEGTFEGYF